MSFLITNEEIGCLQGLPSLHWQLYVILRKEMDIKTGYAGQSFPISLRGLANSCYIEPGQGKQCTGSPSVSKIRIALNALVKIGLIESHSIALPHKKQLIYHLKVAFHHLSASKKHDRFQAHKDSTQHDSQNRRETASKSECYHRFDTKTNKQHDTAQIAKHCTHQDNKNNNTQTHNAREPFLNTFNSNTATATSTPLNAVSTLSDLLSFAPDEGIVAKAKEMGLTNADNPQTLLEFITHTKANGKSYVDWDAAFLQWLVRGERLQNNNNVRKPNHANRKNNKSAVPSRSLVEQVELCNRPEGIAGNVVFFTTGEQG